MLLFVFNCSFLIYIFFVWKSRNKSIINQNVQFLKLNYNILMPIVNLKKVTAPLIKWIMWSSASWRPERVQLVYFVFHHEIGVYFLTVF